MKFKELCIYIQYLILFPGLLFFFIGLFVGNQYAKNKLLVEFLFGKYGFYFPYLICIFILATYWNYILGKVQVLGHLFYLNGVDNEHSKAYKSENNITA